MGFGSEILFILMLGLLILGPKQLHTMLAHVVRVKAKLEDASRGFKSQLAAEVDAGFPANESLENGSLENQTDPSRKSGEDQ